MKRAGLVLSLAGLLVAGTMPAPTTHAGGGPNFTRFVAVGDSLTAGFQDGSLHQAGQETGFVVHLADAFNTGISIPFIAEPGIPTPNPSRGEGLLLKVPGTCQVGATTFATGQTTGRINPAAPATDVAIPGQNMSEALSVKWAIDPANLAGTADTAEDFVLGFPYVLAPAPANTPRSQIETAVGLQPTFLSIWLGSNDALGAALAATVNDDTLTPTATFNTAADTTFAALAGTGAEAVVFNVPDVTVIANLFSSRDLQQLTGLDGAQVKLLFGVNKSAYVPLSALPSIIAIANGQQPPGSLTPNQILTKKEIKAIRKNITAYNTKLKALADANGWAFVDVNAILTNIDRNGFAITGFGTVTTDYLGGLFSLDGVHPTATGHAIVGAEGIKAVNAKYGLNLALPDIAAIAASDPLTCGAQSGAAARVTLEDLVHVAPAARAAERVILGDRKNDN